MIAQRIGIEPFRISTCILIKCRSALYAVRRFLAVTANVAALFLDNVFVMVTLFAGILWSRNQSSRELPPATLPRHLMARYFAFPKGEPKVHQRTDVTV